MDIINDWNRYLLVNFVLPFFNIFRIFLDRKKQILNSLFSLQRFGIKPGLDRIKSLLGKIGNPQENFKSIHIAGTNGKGSVSSMISSVLMSCGYNVGLYTSPHIIRFNERIRINGKEIDDYYLIEIAYELLSHTKGEEITFFEITTAMAFKFFSDHNVDFAVIETGMGGRFDATNVLNPIISVITSISNDHQEYLGNTIKDIAFEKAGIIKYKTDCITSNQNPEVLEVIQKKCDEMDSNLLEARKTVLVQNINYRNDFKMTADFSINGLKYENLVLGLCGEHQIENTQIVLSVIEKLKRNYDLSEKYIRIGIENVKENSGLRGRIELIREVPPFIADVAHNPSAIEHLVKTIQLCGYKNTYWNTIFTAMQDKDIKNILERLLDITDLLMIPNLAIERASLDTYVAEIAVALGFTNIKLFDSINSLIGYLKFFDKPLLITGSFYLLGEFFSDQNLDKLGLEYSI